MSDPEAIQHGLKMGPMFESVCYINDLYAGLSQMICDNRTYSAQEMR